MKRFCLCLESFKGRLILEDIVSYVLDLHTGFICHRGESFHFVGQALHSSAEQFQLGRVFLLLRGDVLYFAFEMFDPLFLYVDRISEVVEFFLMF